MRRLAIFMVLVLSLLTGAMGLSLNAASSPSTSLDSTPAPASPGPPTSGAQILGGLPAPTGADATGWPAEDEALILFRYILPEGEEIGFHEHTGPALWYVESGSVVFTARSGAIWAHCADGCDPRTETHTIALSAPETVTLEAGDWVQQHDTAKHTVRNDGPGDAVILATGYLQESFDPGCQGACL